MKYGLGLRPLHYQAIVDTRPDVDFFEALSEDFMHFVGTDIDYLEKIRALYPIVLHGVSLSIGSTDPLNQAYLASLKKLIDRFNPLWISDHFCWTGVNHINTHDLLPLPLTHETVTHVASRVNQVQDILQQPILLENISSYITFKQSEMTEWEFINAVTERTNCFVLLDVNNIYVNAFNHGFNAKDYLHGIKKETVKQFHLSGHQHCDTHIIDTHDANIATDVWNLYRDAERLFSNTPLVIERDANVPPLQELLKELRHTQKLNISKSALMRA